MPHDESRRRAECNDEWSKCNATYSSAARASLHIRGWNDFHHWWLTMWEAEPRRVAWFPFECALRQPAAMVERLAAVLRLSPRRANGHADVSVRRTAGKDARPVWSFAVWC